MGEHLADREDTGSSPVNSKRIMLTYASNEAYKSSVKSVLLRKCKSRVSKLIR